MTETLRQDLPLCPACGSEEATMLGALGWMVYVRCRVCGWDYLVDVRDAEDIFAE